MPLEDQAPATEEVVVDNATLNDIDSKVMALGGSRSVNGLAFTIAPFNGSYLYSVPGINFSAVSNGSAVGAQLIAAIQSAISALYASGAILRRAGQ